jgi:hypothetical protein
VNLKHSCTRQKAEQFIANHCELRRLQHLFVMGNGCWPYCEPRVGRLFGCIRSRYGVLNPAGTPPHFGLDDPPPDPLLLRCA